MFESASSRRKSIKAPLRHQGPCLFVVFGDSIRPSIRPGGFSQTRFDDRVLTSIRPSDRLDLQPPIGLLKHPLPVLNFSLLGIESMEHREVLLSKCRLQPSGPCSRPRQNHVHDQYPALRAGGGRKSLQDLDCLSILPIVKNHSEQVHVCALDRLRAEEIVFLRLDPLG